MKQGKFDTLKLCDLICQRCDVLCTKTAYFS